MTVRHQVPDIAPAATAGGDVGVVLRGATLEVMPRILARTRQIVSETSTPMAARAEVESGRALEDAYQQGLRDGRERCLQEEVASARREADRSGHEEGMRRGLAEGRESGAAEALALATSARDDALKRLQSSDALLGSVVVQLRTQISARLDASEDDMIALCHAVVCRILAEHSVQPPVVAGHVRAAVTQWQRAGGSIGGSRSLSVRLHPSDLEGLRSDVALLEALDEHGLRAVRWLADPEIGIGGCVLEGAEGKLDARLETQLASLQDLMSRGRRTASVPTDRPATRPAVSPSER